MDKKGKSSFPFGANTSSTTGEYRRIHAAAPQAYNSVITSDAGMAWLRRHFTTSLVGILHDIMTDSKTVSENHLLKTGGLGPERGIRTKSLPDRKGHVELEEVDQLAEELGGLEQRGHAALYQDRLVLQQRMRVPARRGLAHQVNHELDKALAEELLPVRWLCAEHLPDPSHACSGSAR